MQTLLGKVAGGFPAGSVGSGNARNVSRFCQKSIGPGAAALLLATTLGLGPVRADGAFSGVDAAFIDWAVRNCAMKSTDVEHGLVEAANTKGRDAFLRDYMRQYDAEPLKSAADDRSQRDRLCRDLKERYGKEGTRIPHLLVGEADGYRPAPPAQAVKSSGDGKAGHGGRRRGGGS